MSKLYDPTHAIPPQPMIRRQGKRKTHLADSTDRWEEFTACGQRIYSPVRLTAYNADEILCMNCVLERVDDILRQARSHGR